MKKTIFSYNFFTIGFCVIVFYLTIAFSGYLLVPNAYPNAADLQLQQSLKKPMHKAYYLVEKKKVSFVDFWLKGKKVERLFIIDQENEVNPYVKNKFFAQGHTITFDSMKSLRFFDQKYEMKRITHYLGTDQYGRDVMSRTILGTRISILVGFASVLFSLILGISLGLLAGFYRGWVDRLVLWIINVSWSLPTLLLAMVLVLSLGKGFWQIFVAIGLSMWVDIARIIRGEVLRLRELDFVKASRVLGYSSIRTMLRHILPNLKGSIVVLAAANFATAILLESGLSFLGIGVQVPVASWGNMIRENYSFIAFGSPYLALSPGLSIVTLVVAFNFLSVGLRDYFDVKS